MIIDVTEVNYRGFHIVKESDKGWKIVLQGEEIIFPHLTAAQGAIDEFLSDVVPKYKRMR